MKLEVFGSIIAFPIKKFRKFFEQLVVSARNSLGILSLKYSKTRPYGRRVISFGFSAVLFQIASEKSVKHDLLFDR